MGRIGLVALSVVASVLLSVSGAAQAPLAAQEETEGSLILIMDASGSMNQQSPAGGTRLDEAKRALRTVVSELPEDSQVGFRVYGHRVPQSDKARSCRDTEPVVPLGPLDRDAMTAAIDRYDAKGYTPVGYSLRQGAEDLPSQGKRTIVLVSDGRDTCGNPPPCEAARDLESRGVDLTVETVGFVADRKAREQLRCIAEATGGQYRDAGNARELADSLVQLSTRATRTADIEGEEVTGAADPTEAPALEPGSYTDTILPGETLYYGFELEAGQSVDVESTVQGFPGRENGSMAFFTYILDPDLSNASDTIGGETFEGGQPVSRINGVSEEQVEASGSGTYYVELELSEGSSEQQVEYPVELALEVSGGAPETTTPQTTTPQTTTPQATEQAQSEDDQAAQAQDGGEKEQQPAEEPEQGGDSEGSSNTLLVVIVALVALVAALGGALGAVLFMRRG